MDVVNRVDGLRVWYDRKRECYVSNAPIIAAKKWGVSRKEAGERLLQTVRQNREFMEIFDEGWLS